MVDLHTGVQSYLIAKSSKEQVGTSRRRTPAGARLDLRGPESTPAAMAAATKEIGNGGKSFKGLCKKLRRRPAIMDWATTTPGCRRSLSPSLRQSSRTWGYARGSLFPVAGHRY